MVTWATTILGPFPWKSCVLGSEPGADAEFDRLHHLLLHRAAGDHLYPVPEPD